MNMTETDIKFWTALIAAVASLVVAIIAHISNRSNQRDIEKLRNDYTEARAERDAKRDYQYDARKRLYMECGPVLFQLAEHSEAALHRITGLAETASRGNLEPGPTSFLRSHYYRLSTLYRLLAPSAVLKLLQQRLTLVDLSLDRTIYLQYTLARQAFFAFGDEFAFAQLGHHPLEYRPFDEKANFKAQSEPAVYWRQGLPLGVMDGAIEALLAPDMEHERRVMTYSECEAEYNKADSRIRDALDRIAFLIDDFHPRTRPVLWRMLVTQACLYRVLSQPNDLQREEWAISDLQIPDAERRKFDWRVAVDTQTDDEFVLEPFTVAVLYLNERVIPRLQRITPVEDQIASIHSA